MEPVTHNVKKVQFDDLMARFMGEIDRRGVFENEHFGKLKLRELLADYTLSSELKSFIKSMD